MTAKGGGRRRYPAALRVRRKSEYDRIFQGGVSVRDDTLRVIATRSGGATRLGTAVSRKVGESVERNRIRRRIREAFRLARDELPAGLDLVVVPLASESEPPFPAVQRSLISLARKAERRLAAREKERAETAAKATEAGRGPETEGAPPVKSTNSTPPRRPGPRGDGSLAGSRGPARLRGPA